MKFTREERIKNLMHENENKNELEASRGYCEAFVDGQIAVESAGYAFCMDKGKRAMNTKYEWATPDAKSDKQFLMWIWARLHQVYGAKEDSVEMRRLDSIIEKMPGNDRMDITTDKKLDIYRKGKLIWSDPE